MHISRHGALLPQRPEWGDYASIQLELQEGVDHILPGQAGYLMADGWQVQPGEYVAEIHVLQDSEEIGFAEETVLVPQIQEEER